MDVHDAIRKGVDEYRRQNAHETGEADEVDIVVIELGEHSLLELGPGLELAVRNEDGRHVLGLGASQHRRVWDVGDEQPDLAVRVGAPGRMDQRLEVGAAAGRKHRNTDFAHGSILARRLSLSIEQDPR